MWKKVAEMSVREAIAVIAGPREWGATRDSWLVTAARKTKTISARMMRSLWNGEISDDSHWAVREVRRQAAIAQARKEALNVADQYEKIAEQLVTANPNFDRADVAALVRAARLLRGLDCS